MREQHEQFYLLKSDVGSESCSEGTPQPCGLIVRDDNTWLPATESIRDGDNQNVVMRLLPDGVSEADRVKRVTAWLTAGAFWFYTRYFPIFDNQENGGYLLVDPDYYDWGLVVDQDDNAEQNGYDELISLHQNGELVVTCNGLTLTRVSSVSGRYQYTNEGAALMYEASGLGIANPSSFSGIHFRVVTPNGFARQPLVDTQEWLVKTPDDRVLFHVLLETPDHTNPNSEVFVTELTSRIKFNTGN